jgi:hypothetical protein
MTKFVAHAGFIRSSATVSFAVLRDTIGTHRVVSGLIIFV